MKLRGAVANFYIQLYSWWHHFLLSVQCLFWTIAPLTFALVHLPPPPPFPKYSTYRQCVAGRGRGGVVWVVLETIFCRSLTLYFWPDSEPTKLLYHPKQKPRRVGGLRQINTLPQNPFTGQSFRFRHLLLLSISLSFLRYCPFDNFMVLELYRPFGFFIVVSCLRKIWFAVPLIPTLY